MKLKISRGLVILVLFAGICLLGRAQERTVVVAADTITAAVPDSSVRAVLKAADAQKQPKIDLTPFKPNPTRSVLYALVPGLGQIYNRAYWKLPIVYGGLMGCMYAVTWNNKNYKDYSTAYFDLVSDAENYPDNPDKWNSSWQDLLRGQSPSQAISDSRFKDTLKRRKDYYRRYRDLSIIISVGVYALSIIDAYVDAQLFDFDISPDLSMRVEPVVTPQTSFSDRSYGLNCSIKF